MPVRPENRSRYPANWPEISEDIKERAGWRCECTGECGRHAGRRCVEEHGQAARFARGRVVLTVAHLDHQPENCDPENLRAYCQKCHLRYDSAHHAATRRRTRHAAQVPLFADDAPPRPHVCHARGCTVEVHPRLLMCRQHWAQVPMELQRQVWRHYRQGQERNKNPSPEYMAAARAAIDAVAGREGEPHADRGRPCAECGAATRFDPAGEGVTVGGLRLRGWDVCDACGCVQVSKRSMPADAGEHGWRLVRGGRSVDAGGVRIRFDGDGDFAALARRVARLPALEDALRAIAEAEEPRAAAAARAVLEAEHG